MRPRSFAWLLPLALPMTVAVLPAVRTPPATAALPAIATHDNSRAAGTLRDGTLTLSFEIRRGMWHPNGPDRTGTPMLAFAEPGGPLLLPGPMIRVPAGTRTEVTVHNLSDTTLVLRGLSPDPADSLLLAPGATGTVRSIASDVGNRYYQASYPGRPLRRQSVEDGHLAGAIIVDDPSAPAQSPRMQERILVLTASFHSSDSTGRLTNARELYAFNGRAWPNTPRLTSAIGDSLRFRILNVSRDPHPMHLHGVYFRVDSRGGGHRDTILSRAEQRMAVTETLPVGATMNMLWSPERPGTWLMHCHFTFHVGKNPGFGPDSITLAELRHEQLHGHPDADPDQHVEQGMGGLMMAINVPPPPGWRLEERPSRVLRLLVPRDSQPGDEVPSFAPAVDADGMTSPAAGRAGPGAPIILEAGVPATVRVVNRSHDPVAIHWHGIELESLYDGVVGIGGTPGARTRAVAPADSFAARMTPPRAGTFMYHTHLMELRQLTFGLYGPLIVLPAGARWDPLHDHLFMLGQGRTGFLLNGSTQPTEIELSAGETHRLRLMSLTTSAILQFHLVRADSVPVSWTRVAKDGMDLPPHQRLGVRAVQQVGMGETYDMLVTPDAEGSYALQIRAGGTRVLVTQPIRVVRR